MVGLAAKAGIVIGARVSGLKGLSAFSANMHQGAGGAIRMASTLYAVSGALNFLKLVARNVLKPFQGIMGLLTSAAAIYQWVTWTRAIRRARIQLDLLGLDTRRVNNLLHDLSSTLGRAAAKSLFQYGRAIGEIAKLTGGWREEILAITDKLAILEGKDFANKFAEIAARAINDGTISSLQELKDLFPGLIDDAETAQEALQMIADAIKDVDPSNIEELREELGRLSEPLLTWTGAVINALAEVPLALVKTLNWIQHELIGGVTRSLGAAIGVGATLTSTLITTTFGLIKLAILGKFDEMPGYLREKLVKLGDSILDFFATLPNPNNVDWIKSFNADLEADGERNKEFLAKHLAEINTLVLEAMVVLGDEIIKFFSETMPEAVKDAYTWMKDALTRYLYDPTMIVLGWLGDKIIEFFMETAPNAVKDATKWMLEASNKYLYEPMVDAVNAVKARVKKFFTEDVLNIAIEAVTQAKLAWALFLQSPLITAIKDMVKRVKEFFTEDVPNAAIVAGQVIKDALDDWIVEPMKTAFTTVKDWAIEQWEEIRIKVVAVWDKIKSVIEKIPIINRLLKDKKPEPEIEDTSYAIPPTPRGGGPSISVHGPARDAGALHMVQVNIGNRKLDTILEERNTEMSRLRSGINSRSINSS